MTTYNHPSKSYFARVAWTVYVLIVVLALVAVILAMKDSKISHDYSYTIKLYSAGKVVGEYKFDDDKTLAVEIRDFETYDDGTIEIKLDFLKTIIWKGEYMIIKDK